MHGDAIFLVQYTHREISKERRHRVLNVNDDEFVGGFHVAEVAHVADGVVRGAVGVLYWKF